MQQLNPSEISEIIKQAHRATSTSRSEAQNEGTIVSVADGIVSASTALADAMYGEMIEVRRWHLRHGHEPGARLSWRRRT